MPQHEEADVEDIERVWAGAEADFDADFGLDASRKTLGSQPRIGQETMESGVVAGG